MEKEGWRLVSVKGLTKQDSNSTLARMSIFVSSFAFAAMAAMMMRMMVFLPRARAAEEI